MLSSIFSAQQIGNRKQPSLLFLHGFMGSSEDWLSLLPYFKTRYHCILIDLPGHGSTPDLSYDSFSDFTKKLHRFIQHNALSPVTIIGYSLGGRLAASFAVDYPSAVSRLILISTHLGLETRRQKQERLELDKQRALEIRSNFPAFLKTWYHATMWGALQSHPKFNTILGKRKENNPTALAQALLSFSLGKQKNLVHELNATTLDCHFIVGEKDPHYCQLANSYNEALNKASLSIVPSAGHAIHIEAPSFLAKLEL